MSTTSSSPSGTQRCSRCGAIYRDQEPHCPFCPPNGKGPAPSGSGSVSGDWNNVFMSGLIAGSVFAYAKQHYGWGAILIGGLAYGFCIQNRNLRFNSFQKVIGTFLMLLIGTYGKQLVEFFLAFGRH